MLRISIRVLSVLFLVALSGCWFNSEERERERLVEEAMEQAEEAQKEALEALEEGTEKAMSRAEEAMEQAEEAWSRALEAREEASEEVRRSEEDLWTAAREAREEAEETLREARGEEHPAMEEFAEAMGKLGEKLGNLGEAFSENKDVEPIDFRKLQDLLPNRVAGLPRVDMEGERQGGMGIRISQATGTYERGENRITISIVDLGTLKGAAMLGLNWLEMDVDRENSRGFERTLRYEGFPAHEKYERNNDNTRFETTFIVVERYVVKVEGEGPDLDEDDMEDAREEVDVDRLEALREFGT